MATPAAAVGLCMALRAPAGSCKSPPTSTAAAAEEEEATTREGVMSLEPAPLLLRLEERGVRYFDRTAAALLCLDAAKPSSFFPPAADDEDRRTAAASARAAPMEPEPLPWPLAASARWVGAGLLSALRLVAMAAAAAAAAAAALAARDAAASCRPAAIPVPTTLRWLPLLVFRPLARLPLTLLLAVPLAVLLGVDAGLGLALEAALLTLLLRPV